MRFHISLFDVLNSKTKVKIIKFLLTHEASMSEREIASVLKVSHMSVNRAMREFIDINLVDFITVGKAHLWKVNRKSYAYRTLSKLIGGISEIREPVEDLKKILLKGLRKTLVKKVVLFGSVAKKSEMANSDIDLFILAKDKQGKEKIESLVEGLSNKCFEIYGNRLASYILTEQEMKQKKNLEIISEIDKGIQIIP
ncbi:MAG: nucleotidyltransferase domain-containing protein [Candidatus Omnitrophica bacterium]|nr:nucleotidyltransferase domain-containing protein [Candidatus Omnitrophota bacterium]